MSCSLKEIKCIEVAIGGGKTKNPYAYSFFGAVRRHQDTFTIQIVANVVKGVILFFENVVQTHYTISMSSRKEFLQFLFNTYPERRRARKPLAHRHMEEHDAAQIAHEIAHGLPIPHGDKEAAALYYPATFRRVLKEHKQLRPHAYS